SSHASTPLQYRPSSHLESSAVWSQASVLSLHASVVQATPSPQLTEVPFWQPAFSSHASTPLQYRPSSHLESSAVCSHASVLSLQASVVQATPSPQLTEVPFWQPAFSSHVSAPLQYRPSSHLESSAVWSQASVLSLQASVVQPMPSPQLT